MAEKILKLEPLPNEKKELTKKVDDLKTELRNG